MSLDRFEELLKELGRLIDQPLHPDKHLVCRLNVNNTIHLQIEHDARKDRLLIATFICEVPAGKFRENILKEALKSNAPYARTGTLAFSERNNQLALFAYLPFQYITAQKLADFLSVFIEKALGWKQGIESGNLPIFGASQPKSTGFFGLRP